MKESLKQLESKTLDQLSNLDLLEIIENNGIKTCSLKVAAKEALYRASKEVNLDHDLKEIGRLVVELFIKIKSVNSGY